MLDSVGFKQLKDAIGTYVDLAELKENTSLEPAITNALAEAGLDPRVYVMHMLQPDLETTRCTAWVPDELKKKIPGIQIPKSEQAEAGRFPEASGVNPRVVVFSGSGDRVAASARLQAQGADPRR